MFVSLKNYPEVRRSDDARELIEAQRFAVRRAAVMKVLLPTWQRTTMCCY
jgi:hypothetical protein